MGLDSYIKTSPKKAPASGTEPTPRVEAYWRGFRELNSRMVELARTRNITSEEVMNGTPVPLYEEDITELRMELVFGTMFHDYHSRRIRFDAISEQISTEMSTFTNLERISQRGASLIAYTASW